ncbi:MAG: GNAT family N-acetyltransferase [Bacteroidota bacterium]|nr:GNAT family N-acetyltransferase [Bacteroidota bacterium]
MTSLAYKTDLVQVRHEGIVDNCEDYYVIRTPSRKNYFWGNYILIKKNEKSIDVRKWINIYKKEFSNNNPYFLTFGLDAKKVSNEIVIEFQKHGFTLKKAEVLSCSSLKKPEVPKAEITFREIINNEDWDGWVEVHMDESWQFSKETQYGFQLQHLENIKKLVMNNFMRRFGAYINNKMVGELGIFSDLGIGRFNLVSTHQDYRNLRICSNLIYYTGNKTFNENAASQLIIVADDDYFAKNIYKKLGFEVVEEQIGFEWYERNNS